MQLIEIKVPDIGDFDNIPIMEIFVSVGDSVALEDSLIALESDKATMEVPADHAGKVHEILVSVGDNVSPGTVIMKIEAEGEASGDAADDAASEAPAIPAAEAEPSSPPAPADGATGNDREADLVVLGSGPGGYTAAFRAADLGLNVTMIEKYAVIGGVCLNVGCIPSKALLHVARVIDEAHESEILGVAFSEPKIDLVKTRGWKGDVVGQLTKGLTGLAKQRKVNVIHGYGKFSAGNQITVEKSDGSTETVGFKQAIIAAGSLPVKVPIFPHDDPRLIDSTAALELENVPKTMLIVGGGIIGLEMATVYRALGCEVSIVEMMDQVMMGADPDMVRPLLTRIRKQYANIWTSTKVTEMKAMESGIKVFFEGKKAPESATFEKVLVSVGRSPNGGKIDADKAGVAVDKQGFIQVDNQMRTNVPHIFAIGDVVGQPMLAHKAVHEGKIAAEVAAGMKSGFEARVIPSVAYTDPEVAWVGLTETEAKAKGIKYEKGVFPWAASGRSLAQARGDGSTKLLFDPDTEQILGAAVTGANAGDLIAEATLAIEMNADATDLGLTIHPHPTLAETIGFAAEAFEGTITDLYMPKKKKP